MVQLASVEEDVGDLLERARLLAAYSDNDRMNMQIDSLMFEAAERLKGLRKERELDRLSGGALADLASFDGEQCERLRQDIISARAGLDDGLLQRLRGEAANFARKEAARSDGAAARSAILRGLQDLGYEIRMNGEVWTEGVCIAAQRPEEPNYDVELSAPTNGMIQSKVRVYELAGRSAGINQRDVEMEQSWCDDLRRLHVKLASEGIVATIEDERKPGSTAQQPLPPRRGSPKRTTTSPARDQRTMD
jgi:hypothetical protein